MLAVATHNPNAVAETYVRQHMRLIMPGETVGVALTSDKAPEVSIPFHTMQTRPASIGRKLETLFTLMRTGYRAALTTGQERALFQFFEKHSVDMVLAEFGTTGCALRAFCRKANIPLVVNFHGHDATVLGQRRDVRHAYRLLARDAQRIVCGSHHFAGVLQNLGFDESQIEIVPCGIETHQFDATQPKDPNLIVAVGRLTRKKRVDLAIRAFAKSKVSHPNLKVVVIGDGPERSIVEKTIRDLGLDSSVTLMGAQPHDVVRNSLGTASIFIQHSVTAENGDQESQGISLLEAMASGAAVCVTDHNGFSETVVYQQTGLLSPEHDVDGMAANINALARDAELTKSMGRTGRERVEHLFDASILSGRLRSILLEAAKETKQSGTILSPRREAKP